MDSPQEALATVRTTADKRRGRDSERLGAALGAPVDTQFVADLVRGMRRNCRLTLNFHPDRPMADGTTVAAGLLETGEYRPQSMTGVSNGMRFAAGGERTAWETELFGDAYVDGSSRRPVYGALDITNDPFGGSPRFGSSFVVLNKRCFDRATICVGDSHVGPGDIGTMDSLVGVLAGLFESGIGGNALDRALSVDDLLGCLHQGHSAVTPARDLDHYLEAQIHGTVTLRHDVDAVVLDPSFRTTASADALTEAASRYRFDLLWHGGSRLAVAQIPDDFRGPDMRPLAAKIVGDDGEIDAAAIGRSVAAQPFTPPSITGDAYDSPLQQHKRLWHCLLRFGRSA